MLDEDRITGQVAVQDWGMTRMQIVERRQNLATPAFP